MRPIIVPVLLACLSGATSVGSAHAAVIGIGNFTIFDIVGGPYAGQTFTGTFTYDASLEPFQDVPLLSFTTDVPSWAGASLADTDNFFGPLYGLFLFYAPAPVGNTNAFSLGLNGSGEPEFAYGTTVVVGPGVGSSYNVVGRGTFTFTTSIVPEPGSLVLLGTGLIALLGASLRKRSG